MRATDRYITAYRLYYYTYISIETTFMQPHVSREDVFLIRNK